MCHDNAGRMTNVVYADGYSLTNLFNLLGELTNSIDSSGYSIVHRLEGLFTISAASAH